MFKLEFKQEDKMSRVRIFLCIIQGEIRGEIIFTAVLGQFTEKDPEGEIENSGKSIFEIRIPKFCHIQVIVFDLRYLLVAAVGT